MHGVGIKIVAERVFGVAGVARVDDEGVVLGEYPGGGDGVSEEGLGNVGFQLFLAVCGRLCGNTIPIS